MSELLIIPCCCGECWYRAEFCECQNGIEEVLYVPCEQLEGSLLVFKYNDQCYQITDESEQVTDTADGTVVNEPSTYNECDDCCEPEQTYRMNNCCGPTSDFIYVPTADAPTPNVSTVLFNGKCYRRPATSTPSMQVPHVDATTTYVSCEPCFNANGCDCDIYPSSVVVKFTASFDGGCDCAEVEITLLQASCNDSSILAIYTLNGSLSFGQETTKSCNGCDMVFDDVIFTISMDCSGLTTDLDGTVVTSQGEACDELCCLGSGSASIGFVNMLDTSRTPNNGCELPAEVSYSGTSGNGDCMSYNVTVEL
ncbi:MAG: hypothetical protein KC983_05785 [Phycisphaerales bacterium]|nr:hypothetical protein [Phycisphaerales bacterium]